MKVKSSRRLVRRLGLALAVVALFVVPNAQAMPLDMSGSSVDSAQSRQYADDLRVGPPVRKYADDRIVSQVSEHEGYAPINELAQPIVSSSPEQSSTSSTDWGSVSVGFGTLLMVLGLGALLIAFRHSRRGRLAAV